MLRMEPGCSARAAACVLHHSHLSSHHSTLSRKKDQSTIFVCLFFETGFFCETALNSLCRPGWSQTHRDPLPSKCWDSRRAPPHPAFKAVLRPPVYSSVSRPGLWESALEGSLPRQHLLGWSHSRKGWVSSGA